MIRGWPSLKRRPGQQKNSRYRLRCVKEERTGENRRVQKIRAVSVCEFSGDRCSRTVASLTQGCSHNGPAREGHKVLLHALSARSRCCYSVGASQSPTLSTSSRKNWVLPHHSGCFSAANRRGLNPPRDHNCLMGHHEFSRPFRFCACVSSTASHAAFGFCALRLIS